MANSQSNCWAMYLLLDPRIADPIARIRYVGKADCADNRFKQHVRDARANRDRTPKGQWIRKLLSLGMVPVQQVIERGSGGDGTWEQVERGWIAFYRSIGAPILNLSKGGDGKSGRVVGVITRAKISARKRGQTHSPEAKERMKIAQREAKNNGKRLDFKHSDDAKERIRLGHLGKSKRARTDAEKAGLSDFWKGKKKTPAAIEKTRTFHAGRKRSALTRERIGASKRGRTLSAEHKAKIKATLLLRREEQRRRMLGKPSPVKGRRHTEATKEKIRATKARRLAALEAQKQLALPVALPFVQAEV